MRIIKFIAGGLLVLVAILVAGLTMSRPEPGLAINEIGEMCLLQELGQSWRAQVKIKGCYSYRCTRQIQKTGKLIIDRENHALHFDASWVLAETSGFPFGCTEDCMGGGTLDFYLDDLEVGDWIVYFGDERIGNIIIPSGRFIERQCISPGSQTTCEGCCAAGICAEFPGDIVTVSINPDVPDPRCANVEEHQRLKVINNTDETQSITIGDQSFKIKPGGEHLIDQELSTYLQPCCNFLQADPGMGGHCVVLR